MVNIKIIKCDLLNEKSINELIKKLNVLKDGLEKAPDDIVSDMAKYVENEVATNLAATEYKDGNNDATAYSIVNGRTGEAGMQGTQVLYDEFGTGTVGQSSPHPLKENFGLNPYNSGRTIRKVASNSSAENFGIPAGQKYWTYKDNGITVYTQGIPAGKQVFNANESLKLEKESIISKKVGEVISKL